MIDPADGALLAVLHDPSPAAYEYFGVAVCFAGKNIFVGAPGKWVGGKNGAGAAFLFNGDTTSPNFGSLLRTFESPQPVSYGNFGGAMGANSKLLVSAASDTDAGASTVGGVFVFDGDPASPGFGALLKSVSPAGGSERGFGSGCAVNESVIAVSAFDISGSYQHRGLVRLYNGVPESPSFGAPIGSVSGLASDISNHGWTNEEAWPLSSDGGRFLVGSPGARLYGLDSAGAAFVIGVDEVDPGFEGFELSAVDPLLEAWDYFGSAVAGSGPYAAVGASGDYVCRNRAGSAYIFDIDPASPNFGSLLRIITNPNPSSGGGFGASISGNGAGMFAIGAPGEKVGAESSSGAVYIFEAGPALTPTPIGWPTVTPTASLTTSLTPSPSLTFSLTPTPNFTTSPSYSPSVTPSMTSTEWQVPTDSLTPTPSRTPSVAPSPSLPPPVIVRHPHSLVVNAGQPAAFSVEAVSDGPLTYQWAKAFVPVQGGTSNALYFAAAASGDAAFYYCVVTRSFSANAFSLNATLTVLEPSAPNAAAFVEHSVPPQIEAGAMLNIGVIMRNTSAVSWSWAQRYALAVTDDPDNIFQGATRLYSADPVWVADPNGGLETFIAAIKAPDAPGAKSARVRMVEELVQFFGEEATISFEVVPPRNAARDWLAYE